MNSIDVSRHPATHAPVSMTKRAKYAIARTMKASGLLRLAGASKWRGQRLLVLGYHGVSLNDEHVWDPELFLTPSVFAARMGQLRSTGAAVLPLSEALDRLRAGTLPPRAVTLTFDDGFYNFYRAAWPILQQFGYPATVYQTTYYSEHLIPVCNLAWRYLLWKARAQRLNVARVIGDDAAFDLRNDEERTAAFAAIKGFADARKFSGRERDELAGALAGALGIDYAALAASRTLGLMGPSEVREVSRGRVSIELHTHRHRSPEDRRLFLSELDDNQSWIRDVTGSEARHFCYPSGRWHPMHLPWLEERGVLSATTCEMGMATRQSPRYLVPRMIDTMSWQPIEFEAWIAGPGSLLTREATS